MPCSLPQVLIMLVPIYMHAKITHSQPSTGRGGKMAEVIPTEVLVIILSEAG